jgi:hypothetical protein
MKAVGVIGPDFEPRLFDVDEPIPARDGVVVEVRLAMRLVRATTMRDEWSSCARHQRSGFNAPAQLSSWSNSVAAASLYSGAGVKAAKFSKSVNKENDSC